MQYHPPVARRLFQESAVRIDAHAVGVVAPRRAREHLRLAASDVEQACAGLQLKAGEQPVYRLLAERRAKGMVAVREGRVPRAIHAVQAERNRSEAMSLSSASSPPVVLFAYARSMSCSVSNSASGSTRAWVALTSPSRRARCAASAATRAACNCCAARRLS